MKKAYFRLFFENRFSDFDCYIDAQNEFNRFPREAKTIYYIWFDKNGREHAEIMKTRDRILFDLVR